MQEIPLQAIPNQRFSVAIAGVNWQLTLKVANQTRSEEHTSELQSPS